MPMKGAVCILGNRRVLYRMIVISRLHWDGQKDALGERAPATSWITDTIPLVGAREGLVVAILLPRFRVQDRQNLLWES